MTKASCKSGKKVGFFFIYRTSIMEILCILLLAGVVLFLVPLFSLINGTSEDEKAVMATVGGIFIASGLGVSGILLFIWNYIKNAYANFK